MRSLPRSALALIVLFGALLVIGASGPSTAGAIEVEPVIWQLDEDYPEAIGPDVSLPISTVYIKTHDGADWMSTYDDHPQAVSGPDSIRSLIQSYAAQGIEVSAWFVPKGLNFDRQVQMAVQVIDTGVKALYADLEPFQGFCFQDCSVLADQFWRRVRAERPNAHLGVIYDPRPWWWGQSATSKWFSVANSALPMCYWESFVGQVPWNDPAGCVFQAHADLSVLAPGRPLEYVPMLQGNTHASRFLQALDAAVVAGASRVSVWRRGVTGNDIWGLVSTYQELDGPRCEETLVDGCLIREATHQGIYLISGGARFAIPSPEVFNSMGLDWRRVQVVPTGFVGQIPSVPQDGSLVRVSGTLPIYVVYGGGLFPVPSIEQFYAMEFRPEDVRDIPATGLQQIPLSPRDFTRVTELGNAQEYLVLRGGRVPLDDPGRAALSLSGHPSPGYTVPAGSFVFLPPLSVPRGDSDCDGTVTMADVLHLLAYASSLPYSGVCTHLVGDLDCDAGASGQDALVSLRFIAGVPLPAVETCVAVGILHPVLLPGVPPVPAGAPASPTPSAEPTTGPETASPTPKAPPTSEPPSPTPTPSTTPAASLPSPAGSPTELPTAPQEAESPTPTG